MTEPTFFLSELLHDPVTPRTYTADEVDAMLERLQCECLVFDRWAREHGLTEASRAWRAAAGMIWGQRHRHFNAVPLEGVL